jgi:hypothetical protein
MRAGSTLELSRSTRQEAWDLGVALLKMRDLPIGAPTFRGAPSPHSVPACAARKQAANATCSFSEKCRKKAFQ